jgi:hypothetical protein
VISYSLREIFPIRILHDEISAGRVLDDVVASKPMM